MRKIQEGIIFEVDVSGQKWLGLVEFASQYFKHTILVTFTKTPVNEFDESCIPEFDGFSLYTSAQPIISGHWKIITNIAYTLEPEKTKRIVGGEVWKVDECLGNASDNDRVSFPKMLVLGYKIVEKRLVQHSI